MEDSILSHGLKTISSGHPKRIDSFLQELVLLDMFLPFLLKRSAERRQTCSFGRFFWDMKREGRAILSFKHYHGIKEYDRKSILQQFWERQCPRLYYTDFKRLQGSNPPVMSLWSCTNMTFNSPPMTGFSCNRTMCFSRCSWFCAAVWACGQSQTVR